MNNVFKFKHPATLKTCEMVGNSILQKSKEISSVYDQISDCLKDMVKLRRENLYLLQNSNWFLNLIGITRRKLSHNNEILEHLDKRKEALYEELRQLEKEHNRWVVYYNDVFSGMPNIKPIKLAKLTVIPSDE